jgi:hypothetical protein
MKVNGGAVQYVIQQMWRDGDLMGICSLVPEMTLQQVRLVGEGKATVDGDADSFKVVAR